jgi:hypothetical protein
MEGSDFPLRTAEKSKPVVFAPRKTPHLIRYETFHFSHFSEEMPGQVNQVYAVVAKRSPTYHFNLTDPWLAVI